MSMTILEYMAIFGTFPYIKTRNGERIEFKSPNYLIFFTILNIFIQVYSGVTLLKVYRVQTSMPQILTYFYAIYGMVLTLIIRLKKREDTRKFLNSVFASCICDSYGPNGVMFWIMFAIAVILIICLYIVFYLLPIKLIEFTTLFIGLSFWIVVAGHSIDYQVISVCGMLEMSLRALNRELTTTILTHRKLREFKRLHCKFVRLTRDCNRIYGLDLFMTLSCSSLMMFVTINDLIYYITLPYFEDWGMYLPLRLISTVYYVIKLVSISVKMCWLCYRVTALSKEASRTTSILCNKDLQALDSLTQDTFLLLLEQAVHREVEITAFGVFSLNTSLIFAGIGLAATFVILFIQLNEYSYKT